MNKIFYFGFAALMMLAVVGTAAAVDGQGPDFVDADNDAVCDNFVDANDDGKNDNRANNRAGNGDAPRDGTGHKHGGAGGQHRNNQ